LGYGRNVCAQLCFANKRITEELYTKKLQELKQEQSRIQGRIRQYTEADDKFNRSLVTVLNLAKNSYKLFEILTWKKNGNF
jgi:hypothetical protein